MRENSRKEILIQFLKTLFPYFSTVILLVSCGKKIGEPDSQGSGLNDLEPELPSDFKINFISSNDSETTYIYNLTKDGFLKFPKNLPLQLGSGTNMKIAITYNYVDQYDFEFKCFYEQNSSSNFVFKNCLDLDERDLNITPELLSTFSFPVDQGKKIIFEYIKKPDTYPSQILIQYDADWL